MRTHNGGGDGSDKWIIAVVVLAVVVALYLYAKG